jgi:hypothetical protein
MSAIARFFVVAGDRISAVMAAATPGRKGWFSAPRDLFDAVLHENARALEGFDWSGSAFNTLDLYFESRRGFMYSSFGDSAMSRELSQARGSDWLLISSANAARLRAELEAIQFDASDVRAFITDEHGPFVPQEEVMAVEAALTALKAWLAEVKSGSVGLLSIG